MKIASFCARTVNLWPPGLRWHFLCCRCKETPKTANFDCPWMRNILHFGPMKNPAIFRKQPSQLQFYQSHPTFRYKFLFLPLKSLTVTSKPIHLIRSVQTLSILHNPQTTILTVLLQNLNASLHVNGDSRQGFRILFWTSDLYVKGQNNPHSQRKVLPMMTISFICLMYCLYTFPDFCRTLDFHF
jgi:hypothetical protein